MTWTKYEADIDDPQYVSMERWGQDHWSTLAYLESRAVNYKGMIDKHHMRCNNRLHRAFAHHFDPNGKEYPTRLRGGELLNDHDDWSCLEDMVAEKLIFAWHDRPMGQPFAGKAKVQFTHRGLAIARHLRAHKANGGKWSDFVPNSESLRRK